MPTASKNSAISFASGAPPRSAHAAGHRVGRLTLLKTSRSASRCRLARPRGMGSPRASKATDLATDRERPVDEPSLDARRLVEARLDRRVHLLVHAWHARKHRGPHLEHRVRDAQRVEQRDRETDVRPGQEHQPAEVVCERQVEASRRRLRSGRPSGRQRSSSRSSCDAEACSPSVARWSPDV